MIKKLLVQILSVFYVFEKVAKDSCLRVLFCAKWRMIHVHTTFRLQVVIVLCTDGLKLRPVTGRSL